MKNLLKTGAFAALFLSSATALSLPQIANAQTAQDVRVGQMQKALQACGNVPESGILKVCEASLSTILDLQPKLEYVDEVIISYFAETAMRSTLADVYFAQGNLNKNCENVEKMWLARHNASQYSDHPIFPEISSLAVAKKADVATCRKLGGTPKWAAPL